MNVWRSLCCGISKISLDEMFCSHVKRLKGFTDGCFCTHKTIYIPETLVIAVAHTDIIESKTSMQLFCENYGFLYCFIPHTHRSILTAHTLHAFLNEAFSGSPVDLQIIMLIPLWVQRISHSICRVTLSWTVHHHFGKGIWQPCKIDRGKWAGFVHAHLNLVRSSLTHTCVMTFNILSETFMGLKSQEGEGEREGYGEGGRERARRSWAYECPACSSTVR